eukprot:53188-Eustigmatos_ZCMA.PRE.1
MCLRRPGAGPLHCSEHTATGDVAERDAAKQGQTDRRQLGTETAAPTLGVDEIRPAVTTTVR